MESTCCTPEQFALLGIDAATILEVYGWGVGVVILMWSLGYAVGAGLNMIRKV